MSETENKAKLNDFFSQEYDRLKSFVYSKIDDGAEKDAEDIIQDVALKLFSRADSTSPINNVAGLVYRAIRNKIIDALRTRKQNNVPLHDQNESRLLGFMELFYDDSEDEFSEKMRDELIQAIKQLKPHYQHIIIAIDFEGYSYRELAEESDIPEGTLMSRRHRALSLLKTKLEKNRNVINEER